MCPAAVSYTHLDVYKRQGYGSLDAMCNYDQAFLAEQFDTSVWLLEKAVSLALSAKQQRNAELLTVHMIYEGCLSSYFKEYDEGDTARIAVPVSYTHLDVYKRQTPALSTI